EATANDPPYMPAHSAVNPNATLNRYENAYGNHNIHAPNPNKHIEHPFRPQLRRLLATEFGNMTDSVQPKRLSVNEFLDVERRQGAQANPYTSPLQYRALTPHSTDVTLTTLPSSSPLPAYPPTTEGEKEFWARRDRQQMA